MKRLRSIRWRLQLWQGLLLSLVLAGFVFMAWRLERVTQLQRVDQELEERISVLAGALRTPAPSRAENPPPRPGDQDRPPRNPPREENRPEERPADPGLPPSPLEERLSSRDRSLFEGAADADFYYVVWRGQGTAGERSSAAPAAVPRPERAARVRDSRMRGDRRERFHFVPLEACLLVGRSVRSELAAVRQFTWILGAAGFIVLLLGWAGGWWISTRALRPIGTIGAAAARISAGNLAQRIPAAEADDELGDLVGVLNETFARLQDGFARQARFTADAAHELRTPVSVVLTQTQSALARERTESEYRESLAACQRAAQRMRLLIESLLVLARFDSGEESAPRSLCSLDRIARDAVELLAPLAEEQRISLEIEAASAYCSGDSDQLGQVVTNLVGNAIAYNRPDGRVMVRVASGPNSAVLTVSDTGQGIAPEDLPHVFERFYRADKARTGTSGRVGLGLAITKAIVAAHGGTIEVVSEPGRGSTFSVRLPESPASA